MALILNFNGGMNNVTPPHLLPDNMAKNITNLYLDQDGVWKDINNPEIMLDLSATEFSLAIKVIQWKPTNLPVDIHPDDDFVYVVFTSDGKAKLVYRGTTWKSVDLFTDVATANVQTAHDDYQFAWVDGRNHNIARKVVINSDREIVASAIGLLSPKKKPEFVGVKFSDQNDEGTAIKRGKILLACYTYVDEEEVESNPSPVAVIDTIAYMAKGYYTKDGEIFFYPVPGGEYVYTDDMVGSIESFVLSVAIDSEFVKRVNVYVSEADYVESIAPATEFRLTVSKQVAAGVSDTNVIIGAIPGIITASYENDLAPKGDDIALVDGTTFVGNAVNSLGLAQIAEKVWSITLSNLNKYNYINRFIRLDLYDSAGDHPIGADTFADLDWDADAANMSYFRIMDSDLTTPLDVYHYPLASDIEIHKAMSIDAPDSVRATATIGTGLSGVVVTAAQAGTSGNSITIEHIIASTVGEILCNPLVGDRILLTTARGVYHVTAELIDPNDKNKDILIRLTTTDTYKHHIAITLKTQDVAGYPIVSTAEDLLVALTSGLAGGDSNIDDLRSVLSSVATFPSSPYFDSAYVFTKGSDTIYFKKSYTEAVIDGSDITALLGYSTEETKILATAAQVVNAINSNREIYIVATAIELESPGNGYVAVTPSPVSLSGGAGSPSVAITSNISTRMLSWIRIPNLMAHADKTIYLVKFATEPTDMSGEFVEIVPAGATGDQITVAEFYKDVVPENPVYDESVRIADKANVPTELTLTETEITQYSQSNTADSFIDLYATNTATEKIDTDTTVYDELCAAAASVPTYDVTVWRTVLNQSDTFLTRTEEINTYVNSVKPGYAWSRCINRNPRAYHARNVNLIGIRTFGDLGDENHWSIIVKHELYGVVNKVTVQWEYRYGNTLDRREYSSQSLDLTANSITCADGDIIHSVLSWKQKVNVGERTGSTIECTVAIMINGYIGTAILEIPNALLDFTNFDKNMYMLVDRFTYEDEDELLPRHYGIRFENYLDEWGAINIMRFMPYYPTDGIGAYDEFNANTASTPGISFVNKNCIIDTISINADNRPGRLQWGSFGAMPDLNEYSLNEDIMRIVPVKSYQPTDEHNTILIITKNNTHRLALLGDTTQSIRVIKELSGVGLVSRSGLCETNKGIAWISKQGIWFISQAGIANISDGIIDITGIDTLVYDFERNWIWCRGTTNTTYVYQVNERVWWEYAGAVAPDDFMGCINSETGWISYTNNVMYQDSNTAHTTTYPTAITTRAVAMQRTIMGRIKAICALVSGTYKFIVRMYGQYYTSGVTRSAKYTGTNNARIAVPGSRSDYLQLVITEVNNIIAIEIEERERK